MAEVEEIEDAVGVDAHGAAADAAPGLLGGGGGIRGGRGLGALPLPGIGDSRHLSGGNGTAATEEEERGVDCGVTAAALFSLAGDGKARPRAGAPIKSDARQMQSLKRLQLKDCM